ncbi:hypothetical protein IV102_26680, partial [bacterium]|nr:hypothetical protein [bacterium]
KCGAQNCLPNLGVSGPAVGFGGLNPAVGWDFENQIGINTITNSYFTSFGLDFITQNIPTTYDVTETITGAMTQTNSNRSGGVISLNGAAAGTEPLLVKLVSDGHEFKFEFKRGGASNSPCSRSMGGHSSPIS